MTATAIDWTTNWLLISVSQNFVTTVILVPAVWMACRLFHRRPTVQHLLWLLLLVKLVTPPIPGFVWSIPGRFLVLQYTQGQSTESRLSNAGQLVHSEQTSPLVSSSTNNLDFDSTGTLKTLEPTVDTSGIFFRIALLGWFAGAIRLLLKYLKSLRSLRQILRNASPADTELSSLVNATANHLGVGPLRTLVSSNISSPFISCTSRVELVWPIGLTGPSSDSFRSLVAHEVAHVRRGDHIVAWLELFAAIVWWWNPVYWFIQRQLRITAELACDAIALEAFPDDRCFYAEKLLELSASSSTEPPPLALAVGDGSTSTIERRITMIVSDRVTCKLGIPGLLTTILIGICAAPGWALTQADDGNPTLKPGPIPSHESSKRANHENREESTQSPDSNGRQVTLNDGVKLPLDSQGLLAPKLLGKSHVVDWNSPLTIAESGESIQVRLSDKPLELDLRKGDGARQALIRVRSIHGPINVQLQLFRETGMDAIRLEIRTVENLDQKAVSSELVSKLTLLTPKSDIEVVRLEGSISIRKIIISEGRAGESPTNSRSPR